MWPQIAASLPLGQQREQLVGLGTHLLEMTATPIPRTTALLHHGVIGYSHLRQTHAPKTITTRLFEGAAAIRGCFADLAHDLAAGERLLVIYPLRGDVEATDSSEHLTVTAAVQRWERWAPGRVGSLTSRDDEAEAQGVLDRFNAGQLQILISTSVVEVGINLVQLHRLAIISPERHGLLALHQMRGRLVREGGHGQCALICPRPLNDAQRKRLGLFVRTTDGLVLANLDLALRGAGDIRPTSDLQSGALRGCLYGVTLSQMDLQEASAVMAASCSA